MPDLTGNANVATLKSSISEASLDQLFREARTYSAWLREPVPLELLRQVYELARLGPTSANGSPARFVFVTTQRPKRFCCRLWLRATSRKRCPRPSR